MTDPQQLQLVRPDHGLPIDPRDQCDRIPGVDAPCFCAKPECRWPFCRWQEHADG
jgi:hypothetical protein